MQNTQNDMQSNVPHGDQNDIRRPKQFVSTHSLSPWATHARRALRPHLPIQLATWSIHPSVHLFDYTQPPCYIFHHATYHARADPWFIQSHSPIRTQDVGREQQLLQLPAGTPEVQTASPQTELQRNEITLRAAAERIQRHRVAIIIVFAISAQQPSLEDKICFSNTGVLEEFVTVRRVREMLLDIAKRYKERESTQQSLIFLNSFAPPDSESIFKGQLEGIQTELEQLAYQLRKVATLFDCWKKLNGQPSRQAEPK